MVLRSSFLAFVLHLLTYFVSGNTLACISILKTVKIQAKTNRT
eukprot:gene835-473_t